MRLAIFEGWSEVSAWSDGSPNAERVLELEAMDATEAMIAAEIGIEEALMGAAREY